MYPAEAEATQLLWALQPFLLQHDLLQSLHTWHVRLWPACLLVLPASSPFPVHAHCALVGSDWGPALSMALRLPRALGPQLPPPWYHHLPSQSQPRDPRTVPTDRVPPTRPNSRRGHRERAGAGVRSLRPPVARGHLCCRGLHVKEMYALGSFVKSFPCTP